MRLVHVKNGIVENIKKVSESATVTEIQKICKLGSAQILRKVLSVWAEWLIWVTDALGAWFALSWCTKRTPIIIIIIIIIIMWTHCAMLRPLREQLQLKKIPQRAVRSSEWREVSTLCKITDQTIYFEPLCGKINKVCCFSQKRWLKSKPNRFIFAMWS